MKTSPFDFPSDFFPLTAFHKESFSLKNDRSSIVNNARYHRKNRSSLWLDIQEAFGSNKTKHLQRFLQQWIDRDTAWVFSRLLTYQGKVQQGAPVSPYLFNLLMHKFVTGLAELLQAPTDRTKILGCKRYKVAPHNGLVVTMYGDDICISSPEEEFPKQVEKMVKEYISRWPQFKINKNKVRRGARGILEFPGVVVVNGRLRPQASYIESLVKLAGSNSITPSQLRGHRSFVKQFGHDGKLKILSRLFQETS